MKRVTTLAHEFLIQHLSPEATLVDLTMGNGNDTLFGVMHFRKVIAFDIQAEALIQTARRCAGYDNLRLHHLDHRHLDQAIQEPVDAYIFNSGYLPHAESALTTQADSTLEALEKALERLKPQGYLVLTFYRKQAHGLQEADACTHWLTHESRLQIILTHQYENDPLSPILIIAQKR